jgi:hypothetical protein
MLTTSAPIACSGKPTSLRHTCARRADGGQPSAVATSRPPTSS